MSNPVLYGPTCSTCVRGARMAMRDEGVDYAPPSLHHRTTHFGACAKWNREFSHCILARTVHSSMTLA